MVDKYAAWEGFPNGEGAIDNLMKYGFIGYDINTGIYEADTVRNLLPVEPENLPTQTLTTTSINTSNTTSNNITKMSVIQDVNGEVLVGANIIDRGDKYNGAMSDFDGGFSITGHKDTYVQISYLGFTPREFQLKNLPSIIKLDGSIENLEEVYLGTIKTKKDNNWIWLIVLAIAGYLYKKKIL